MQYDLLHRIGEPYPALIMPAFQQPPGDTKDGVKVNRAEAVFVLASGRTITFTMRELFVHFPDSHHGMLSRLFAPIRPKEPIDRTAWRYCVFPGLRAGLINRAEPAHLAAMRSWFHQRAAQLLPGEDVERVEIVWYRDIYQLESGSRTSNESGRFTLDLQEPHGD